MPMRNREEAVEVEDRIKSFFNTELDERAYALPSLLVEVLDFEYAIAQPYRIRTN